MIGKHADQFERKLRTAIVGLAVLLIVLGVYLFFQFTNPYAVSGNGTKIEEPWVVKIGDKEAFVIACEADGNAIIDGIRESYRTENTREDSIAFSPEMTVEKKTLTWSDGSPSVTEVEDAVAQVVVANRTAGKPLVTVTATDEVTETKPIVYKTEYRESSKLKEGELKVISPGKNGERLITTEVVRSNGRVLSERVLSKKVISKPAARVIEKGKANSEDDEKDSVKAAEPVTAAKTQSTAVESGSAETTEAAQTEPSTETESTAATESSDKGSEEKQTSAAKVKSASSSAEESKDKAASQGVTGQDIVDYALKFVGNPYVYGGSSLTNGTDCSGFTMSVYKKFGISLPRTSTAQRSSGRAVPYSQARPGDLICYSGHVGIYIGKGKIVHASTPSTGIKVGTATYRNILTVRRMID